MSARRLVCAGCGQPRTIAKGDGAKYWLHKTAMGHDFVSAACGEIGPVEIRVRRATVAPFAGVESVEEGPATARRTQPEALLRASTQEAE